MEPTRLTKAQEQRLRRQLDQTPSKRVYRRTLGVLQFGCGEPAEAIARMLGVHRSNIYRWWEAYARAHDPAALHEGPRPGRPALWTGECMRQLQALLATTPQQWGYFAVDWTVPLLREQLAVRTGQRFCEDTIRQALHDLDYVRKRPRHGFPPDPEREKKTPDPPPNRAFAQGQRLGGPG
jgi:transposase